jgi:oligopeptide/dipeptide ABC transporter ATP-binding protein
MTEALLSVRGLDVSYLTSRGRVRAVTDVSFDVAPGQTVGIVGDSGSGKSTVLRALLRLLPASTRVAGQVVFRGRDLMALGEQEMQRIRGGDISLIVQDPVNAFNPSLTIGDQLRRILRLHHGPPPVDGYDAEINRMLRKVGIDAGQLTAYPFSFSQGQLQRIMIAAACLGGRPSIVLADEPTSSLDVSIEAQVLQLLRDLRRELTLALVLVTHNLAIVAELCERVLVMHAGRVVEQGDIYDIFERPRHLCTQQLIRSIPGVLPSEGRHHMERPPVSNTTPLVEAIGLEKHFPVRTGLIDRLRGEHRIVRAVDGVDLSIGRGEVLGLIGESGSGKTTFGRTLLQLYRPTAGQVRFEGRDISAVGEDSLRTLRRRMQMVFQNPYSAVNRRKTLHRIVSEPLEVHHVGTPASRRRRAQELLDLVGLPTDLASRYPHEVSGGELQRVAIARALALRPDFLVADEPTTSLDVRTRGQVVELLTDLQERLGLAMLFIGHDLSVVSTISTRVAVMYLGRVVEVGRRDAIEIEPLHPYTRALLSAAPQPDPRRRRPFAAPVGDIPSALYPPGGCHYHPRCPLAMAVCASQSPLLEEKTPGHLAACHAVPRLAPLGA